MANEVLRLGVQRPASEWLPAGLRLHASLLRRCSRRGDAEGPEDGPWSPSAALKSVLVSGTYKGSSDLRLAAVALLDQLLPLYREAGNEDAEDELLSRLAHRHKVLAPLRQLPQLAAAVQAWLVRRFPKPDGGAAGGKAGALREGQEDATLDSDSSDSPSASSPRGERGGFHALGGRGGRGRGGRGGRGGRSYRLSWHEVLGPVSAASDSDYAVFWDGSKKVLSWWLSDPDESTVLQRAQASDAGPWLAVAGGGRTGVHAWPCCVCCQGGKASTRAVCR